MAEVFCYSSDYPHIEGGQISFALAERLRPLGAEVVESFFVRNAEILLAPPPVTN